MYNSIMNVTLGVLVEEVPLVYLSYTKKYRHIESMIIKLVMLDYYNLIAGISFPISTALFELMGDLNKLKNDIKLKED